MQKRYNWESGCRHCLNKFKNKTGLSRNKFYSKRYCSQACYLEARKENNKNRLIPTKKCKYCSKEFNKSVNCSKLEWNRTKKYCSKNCANKASIGRKLDKSTVEKIINSNKKNHSDLIDYASLRKRALKRDNYTCQKCAFVDKEIMEVDHIKQRKFYPELVMDLNNLMTLCPNCHRRKTLDDIKVQKP